jgi:hypothetical protein
MGPGPLGTVGLGALSIQQVVQNQTAYAETDTANADNHTWATLSFLVGAAAVTGVWYFYFRPKGRRG